MELKEGVLKAIQEMPMILVDNFFDCECEENFIKYFSSENYKTGKEILCPICKITLDDAPNSRLNEMIKEVIK